ECNRTSTAERAKSAERMIDFRSEIGIAFLASSAVVTFYALTTFPLRMQAVQTRMRFVVAPTRACTGRRFTFQRRLVTLWAWLMRFPDCGFLPQMSHCCAMTAWILS